MFDGFIPSDKVKHSGLWLSLVERSVRDREVAGSNPVNPTIYFLIKDAYKTYERSIYLRLPKNISILIRASNQREYNLRSNRAHIRHNRVIYG